MRKNALLSSYVFAASFAASRYEQPYSPELKRKKTPKKTPKVIPKGCQQYHFKSDGSFFHNPIDTIDIVFDCIAKDERNALRKFKNFMQSKK